MIRIHLRLRRFFAKRKKIFFIIQIIPIIFGPFTLKHFAGCPGGLVHLFGQFSAGCEVPICYAFLLENSWRYSLVESRNIWDLSLGRNSVRQGEQGRLCLIEKGIRVDTHRLRQCILHLFDRSISRLFIQDLMECFEAARNRNEALPFFFS